MLDITSKRDYILQTLERPQAKLVRLLKIIRVVVDLRPAFDEVWHLESFKLKGASLFVPAGYVRILDLSESLCFV